MRTVQGHSVRHGSAATEASGDVDGEQRLADAGIAVEDGEFPTRKIWLPEPADSISTDRGEGFGDD